MLVATAAMGEILMPPVAAMALVVVAGVGNMESELRGKMLVAGKTAASPRESSVGGLFYQQGRKSD